MPFMYAKNTGGKWQALCTRLKYVFVEVCRTDVAKEKDISKEYRSARPIRSVPLLNLYGLKFWLKLREMSLPGHVQDNLLFLVSVVFRFFSVFPSLLSTLRLLTLAREWNQIFFLKEKVHQVEEKVQRTMNFFFKIMWMKTNAYLSLTVLFFVSSS